MARFRYRWLLPLGHALVDVIVISHLAWQGYKVLQAERYLCSQPSVVRSDGPLPEGTVSWDPMYIYSPPPREFMFVVCGTPPAGMVSFASRPEAAVQNCGQLWDPVWFSIHEAIALTFWFLVGWKLDSSAARLRKLLGGYLGLRFALALLCWLTGEVLSIGIVLEMLFWLWFGPYCLIHAFRWLLRRWRPLVS